MKTKNTLLISALLLGSFAHANFCKDLVSALGNSSKSSGFLSRIFGQKDSGNSFESRFKSSVARMELAEEQALKIQHEDPSTAGLIAFNEHIDRQIRSNPDFGVDLLELALRRLPYLKNEPFNLILSGGVVEPWLPKIKQAIQDQGLYANLILLPGSLSFARSDRRDVPDFPAEFIQEISSRPSIFMDDTYTNGGTAQAVRLKLQSYGGNLDGVFVVYEGGKGDPSSLYKSGRMNQRPPSMGQFLEQPVTWNNLVGLKRIGIELDGTIYIEGSTQITAQAERFLNVLSKMGIEVVALRNGNPSDAPQRLKSKFTSLNFVNTPQVDISIGNWGRQFLGQERLGNSRPKSNFIETVKIADQRSWGQFEQGLLDPNYFLNRLSEEGIFEPVFQSRTTQPRFTQGEVRIADLRKQKVKSLAVDQVIAIQEAKERVRQLSLLDGESLDKNSIDLLLKLAQNTQNSFEIGALIKLSGSTGDRRWLPILNSWVQQWSGIARGWQTFLMAEAELQIQKLSKK